MMNHQGKQKKLGDFIQYETHKVLPGTELEDPFRRQHLTVLAVAQPKILLFPFSVLM
jgi:hypothetical protein